MSSWRMVTIFQQDATALDFYVCGQLLSVIYKSITHLEKLNNSQQSNLRLALIKKYVQSKGYQIDKNLMRQNRNIILFLFFLHSLRFALKIKRLRERTFLGQDSGIIKQYKIMVLLTKTHSITFMKTL